MSSKHSSVALPQLQARLQIILASDMSLPSGDTLYSQHLCKLEWVFRPQDHQMDCDERMEGQAVPTF